MARPQGVRIVREDGTVTPCELVHIGDEDGQDMWEIAGVEFHVGRDHIAMDVLPAHTGIRFSADLPGGA